MSMSMNLVGTGIFAAIFIVAVIAQVSAKKFYPVLDNHYYNNGWNDVGGFCGSFAGHRLCRRNDNIVYIANGVSISLVSHA